MLCCTSGLISLELHLWDILILSRLLSERVSGSEVNVLIQQMVSPQYARNHV